ncbi:FAD-dependent monooxygenase [Nonomuraea sp. JJY05]|uniref:FAD-dependent monooxygenase n=1 Tax=Nonomuraea sp. JJY05 TaxID=3350255 RepID=UPI00373F275E
MASTSISHPGRPRASTPSRVPAAELRRAGVPVLVLDRLERPGPHSKALTRHPRMIEVLAMRGMEKTFLEEGIAIPNGHFGMLETRLDFRPLPTRHPYTLFFPQARTERLLEESAVALGARVLRGHAVTGLAQDSAGVEVSVEGPDGPYAVRARYVAGCDGAGSTVRRAAGIDFPGTDATVWGFLGDVHLDDPPSGPSMSAHTLDGGVMVVGMPGGHHRVAGHARDLGATTYEGALGDDVPAEWRAVGAALIRPDGHVHWAFRVSRSTGGAGRSSAPAGDGSTPSRSPPRWPRGRRRSSRRTGAPPSAGAGCSTWPRGERCSTATSTPRPAGSAAAARVPPGWSARPRTWPSRCATTRPSASPTSSSPTLPTCGRSNARATGSYRCCAADRVMAGRG